MVATKNRALRLVIWLFSMALLVAACSPTGPGALIAGKKSLEAGKFEAAVAELQTAVRLMPTNAAAWNYLGVAYHQTGQWTNALVAYSQALRFNRELLEVRFNLGCLQLEQNNPEAAAVELFAYTARRPNDAGGWTKLGLAQQRTRDFGAAEKSFREALRCDPQNVEALNGLGLVFAQRNRPREAADAFAGALKIEPKDRAALLNYATIQQQLNNPAEALQRYREYLALQPRPQDWEAVSAIVRALEPPVAVPARPEVATTAIAAPSSSVAVRPAPAVATSPRSNPPAVAKAETPPPPVNKPAVSVASTVASASPPPATQEVKPAAEPVVKPVVNDSRTEVVRTENPTPPPTPSGAPESKGFFSRLNPFRRDSKASSPESKTAPTATASQTSVETSANSESYAILTASKVKAGDRKAAEYEVARGQQAQRAKRPAEALQYYRRAVTLDESYFEAHYCLGLAAFEIRNFKLATSAWQNAIALRPDSGDARYNYALALKADGRFREAVDELEKLLALHPDEARGHLTLGILYADQVRDIPRARQHYQRVLQLDPRNPQAEAIRYWLVANPR